MVDAGSHLIFRTTGLHAVAVFVGLVLLTLVGLTVSGFSRLRTALPLLDLRGFGVFLPFDDLSIAHRVSVVKGFLKTFFGLFYTVH